MKLHIQNIRKEFLINSGRITALTDINLEVRSGEFICFVGPSGCGKSTLLNLIAGLEQTTSGSVVSKGKIGFMFQEATLFPWLKVKDNVAFGLRVAKRNKDEISEKVDQYLKLVHLFPFKEAYPHELSGGMKQRVALARALILDPDILLMDEPFAALDAQTREILHGELQEIWQTTKKTIIFVTHNIREAVCLGTRVLVFTAQPGRVKKEYRIDLKRPREMSSLEVMMLSNEIYGELKEEIEVVVKRMYPAI